MANLNLKNDILFSAFFSRKGNEKYLKEFLEELLKIKIETIEIREEVNLERLAKDEKGGRLDLQAKIQDGTIVNIELRATVKVIWFNRWKSYLEKILAKSPVASLGLNMVTC